MGDKASSVQDLKVMPPILMSGRLSLVVRICAALVACIGLAVLLDWLRGATLLAALGSGRVPVAPSTALLFLFYAAALFLRTADGARPAWRQAAAGLVCLGGVVALLLLVLSYNGIMLDAEHLGLAIVSSPGEIPRGHMSPATALCFLLAAMSFLSSMRGSPARSAWANAGWGAAFLLIAAGLVLSLAYLYGTPLMYQSGFIPPAALTGVAFMLMGIALLCLALPYSWLFSGHSEPVARASYLFLALFFVVAGSIVVSGYVYHNHLESRYKTEVERQLRAVADLKANEIVLWRSERLADASIFSKNVNFSGLMKRFIRNPDDAEARMRMQVWLSRMQGPHQYSKVCVHDLSGKELLASPQGLSPHTQEFRAEAAEALRSGGVVFRDFHRNELDRRVYLGLLVPVFDPEDNSRPLGVLAVRIDPEHYLYPYISRWPTSSRSAETLLVRREGNEVVFLNALRFRKDSALNLRRPLDLKDLPAAQAALGRQGIMQGIDYRGVPVIADLRRVPDSPWMLVTRMDLSEVYAPLRERLWMMVGFIVTLLSGSAAAFGLVWRQQTARFYRERFEASEEIGVLNSRLNRLIEAIKDLASARDIDAVQGILRNSARRLTGADGAAIVFRDGDLCYYADEDAIGPLWKGQRFPMKICISGWAMQNKQSVVIDDIYADERIPADAYSPTFVKSLAMVPINTREPLGAIGNYWASHHHPTEIEVQLLQTLADAAARAIENIRLYESLEQRVQERTAQLEAANKELEGFSYSVSHDLRAPLRHITGFAELLMKKAPAGLDEKSRHYLAVISESATQMGRLIDDLLSFSRMGRSEMLMARVDLAAIVSEVAGVFRAETKDRSIDWKICELPEAYGDKVMLRIVLENLLSNAVKFTRNTLHAQIEIGCMDDSPRQLTCFIRDNGAGFDMKYADKLFGLFQRLHGPEEFEGTGLGLANVRRIIHRHGGRTWAEGRLNEGATVFFSLPKPQEV